MVEVLFFVAGIGAIAGAIGVIAVRNPFFSVLALVSHLLCLAALFLLLHAEFVAAAQVVVYAGAVMVLYVFVVAYVGGQDEPLGPGAGSGLRPVSMVFGALLFIELCAATLGSGLKLVDTNGAHIDPGFGSAAQIGQLLLTRFLLPFEAASFLLLIAAVGAVVLARRRGGLTAAEDQARYTAMDLLRPAYTGTMAEGVGGTRRLPPVSERAAATAPAEAPAVPVQDD
ncbi:MAG: NADH-quinone oxidoreductase subunit [Solirubrobacteraceae bacterium]|jgi:NADH-quinone oxidoreductase subunit J|nr:NADH-quinone oxidoreductase subunit [Solirubrobacteraceae bacterium]